MTKQLSAAVRTQLRALSLIQRGGTAAQPRAPKLLQEQAAEIPFNVTFFPLPFVPSIPSPVLSEPPAPRAGRTGLRGGPRAGGGSPEPCSTLMAARDPPRGFRAPSFPTMGPHSPSAPAGRAPSSV